MAEAEYWRFTVARDCQKKNTSETHSEYSLGCPSHPAMMTSSVGPGDLTALAFKGDLSELGWRGLYKYDDPEVVARVLPTAPS